MLVHILDVDSHKLRAGPGLERALTPREFLIHHDPRIAEMHLRSIRIVAITVVLHKPKRGLQPLNSGSNIGIADMWQQSINRDGAVLDHGNTIAPMGHLFNGG